LVSGLILAAAAAAAETAAAADQPHPLGEPGLTARYVCAQEATLPGSVVQSFCVRFGRVEEHDGRRYQWFALLATKANQQTFQAWLLAERYPPESLAEAAPAVARYLIQDGDGQPLEFRHRFTGRAVLPVLGAWKDLFPRAVEDHAGQEPLPPTVEYLGHRYRREALEPSAEIPSPPEAKVLRLLPDVLVGVPHNTRQADETRRYDESDYALVRLTEADYAQMIDAGMNCLAVDPEQARWVEDRDVFYWGVGGDDVPYPACLYRSNYLGPSLFLDEPAVGTRDHVIRPRLAEDPALRKTLTPQMVLEEFKTRFRQAKYEGVPTNLLKGLTSRADVQLGSMKFLQQNLYTWETMIATAAYQLTEGEGGPPAMMVFEPPGHVGTRRTLPEMNMAYGCQIPVDDPNNLTSILFGFLRGGARVAGRGWGTSIYGAVDRADAPWHLTRAYDLGATGFFFWDSYRLACVPYGECLALARHLKNHVENRPQRDLERLRRAAETAILLPPGYNLGHVHMGRGNLWGLGELNLERTNPSGVKYRMVMHNFFTEIERSLRLGVGFDLLWDLPTLNRTGYREVVRIREDGRVEVTEEGRTELLDEPRTPPRPAGNPPQLLVELSRASGAAPLALTARARVTEGSAPVYYTVRRDAQGVYHNARVLWELFGPEDEDYRTLLQSGTPPRIQEDGSATLVELDFQVDRPGTYRLRAATADLAGRTAVVWTTITVDR
jgi:hypothetical protein